MSHRRAKKLRRILRKAGIPIAPVLKGWIDKFTMKVDMRGRRMYCRLKRDREALRKLFAGKTPDYWPSQENSELRRIE